MFQYLQTPELLINNNTGKIRKHYHAFGCLTSLRPISFIMSTLKYNAIVHCWKGTVTWVLLKPQSGYGPMNQERTYFLQNHWHTRLP